MVKCLSEFEYFYCILEKIETLFLKLEDQSYRLGSFNAGQKYCRMLQREHSAILSTFINLRCKFDLFVSL